MKDADPEYVRARVEKILSDILSDKYDANIKIKFRLKDDKKEK